MQVKREENIIEFENKIREHEREKIFKVVAAIYSDSIVKEIKDQIEFLETEKLKVL